MLPINYEIYLKLSVVIGCIWSVYAGIRSILTKYNFILAELDFVQNKCNLLEKTIRHKEKKSNIQHNLWKLKFDDLHHYCDDISYKYAELSDFVYFKVDDLNDKLTQHISSTNALRIQVHTMDILLSTINDDFIRDFKDIDAKHAVFNGEIVDLKNKFELHTTQLFNIPKYIGVFGDSRTIGDPILTTASRLSEVFKTDKFNLGKGFWMGIRIYLDQIINSNIKLLDFNKLPDNTGTLSVYFNDEYECVDIKYLLLLATNNQEHISYNGRGILNIKTELIKYNQMKQICDQHHIEVVFLNINELYTKYLDTN